VNRVAQVRTQARGLVTLTEMAATWGQLERIAIVHTNARAVADILLQQLNQKREVWKTLLSRSMLVEITPAIGVHTGPGAVGIVALSQAPQP
jgi:fatty acid-binding protein DegV